MAISLFVPSVLFPPKCFYLFIDAVKKLGENDLRIWNGAAGLFSPLSTRAQLGVNIGIQKTKTSLSTPTRQ